MKEAAMGRGGISEMLCTSHQKSGVFQHVSDESHDMEAREGSAYRS
jgi:hypothetical protein